MVKFGTFTGTVQKISPTGEVEETQVFKEGTKVRTFSGGGGGGTTPVRSPEEAAQIVAETPEEEEEAPTRRTGELTTQESTALIRREQIRREAQESGQALTRLQLERRLGGGRGVSALRSARRKGFRVIQSPTPEPTPTERPRLLRRKPLPQREDVQVRQTLLGARERDEPVETGVIFLRPEEARVISGESQEREFTRAEREAGVTRFVVPETGAEFLITGRPRRREIFPRAARERLIGIGVPGRPLPLITARQIATQVERIPKVGRIAAAFIPTTPGEVAIDVALIRLGTAIRIFRAGRRARQLQKVTFIGLEQTVTRGRIITRAAFEIGGRRIRAGQVAAITERIARVGSTQLTRTATIGAVGRRITFPLGRQILVRTRPFLARQISAIREGTLIARLSVRGVDIRIPLARAFKQVGVGVVRTTRGILGRRIGVEPFFGISAGVLERRLTLAVSRGRGALGQFVSGGIIFRRQAIRRVAEVGVRGIPIAARVTRRGVPIVAREIPIPRAAPLARLLSAQALTDVQQAVGAAVRQAPITPIVPAVFPRARVGAVTKVIRQITTQAQIPVAVPRITAIQRARPVQALRLRQAQRQRTRTIAVTSQIVTQAERQASRLGQRLITPQLERQIQRRALQFRIPTPTAITPRIITPIVIPLIPPIVPPPIAFPLLRGRPLAAPRRRRKRIEELIFVPSFTAAELGITAVLSEKQLKRIARFPGVGIRPIPIR